MNDREEITTAAELRRAVQAVGVPSVFRIESLPNGLVRVEDRESGLTGCWDGEGRPRFGDLTRTISTAQVSLLVREHLAVRELAVVGCDGAARRA